MACPTICHRSCQCACGLRTVDRDTWVPKAAQVQQPVIIFSLALLCPLCSVLPCRALPLTTRRSTWLRLDLYGLLYSTLYSRCSSPFLVPPPRLDLVCPFQFLILLNPISLIFFPPSKRRPRGRVQHSKVPSARLASFLTVPHLFATTRCEPKPLSPTPDSHVNSRVFAAAAAAVIAAAVSCSFGLPSQLLGFYLLPRPNRLSGFFLPLASSPPPLRVPGGQTLPLT